MQNDLDINELFTIEVLSTYPDFRSRWNSQIFPIRRMRTIDLVRWLDAKAPPPERPSDPPVVHLQVASFWPYWDAFKIEFKLLLCTKNRKYSSLRRELRKQKGTAQPALVSVISAAIGANLGTMGVVIAPIVVMSLMTVLSIGREAYCRTVDIDSLIAIPPDPPD
jgi:hypothetical protein